MSHKKPPDGQPSRLDLQTVTRHVGDRIGLRRRSLGLNQRELERLSGCPPGAIGRLERGMDALGAGHLFAVAKVLEVKVDFFFEGLAGDQFDNAVEPTRTSAQIRELERLLEAYAAITDPEVRQTLFDLLVSMAMETPDPDKG